MKFKNLISRLYGDAKEELEAARSHHPMSIYSWKATANMIIVPGKAIQYGIYMHNENSKKSPGQDIILPCFLEAAKLAGYVGLAYYLLK